MPYWAREDSAQYSSTSRRAQHQHQHLRNSKHRNQSFNRSSTLFKSHRVKYGDWVRILSPAVPAKRESSPQNLVAALPTCLITVLYLAVGCLATDSLGAKEEIIEQQGFDSFFFFSFFLPFFLSFFLSFFGVEEARARTNWPRRWYLPFQKGKLVPDPVTT